METLPSSLHFVGAGGIGMSALAQMAVDLGFTVTGSDRSAEAPENARIIGALKRAGVRIYPQDGSRFQEEPLPGALVYSTAIEEGNPDFAASAGIPRLHRSEAMRLLIEASSSRIVAVAGSCGKTTVTAMLSEALARLGADPSMIGGGLSGYFAKLGGAGNAFRGKGSLCVIEADESDKSLLNYTPEHSLILNIGTDHYSKEELTRVFRDFLLLTGSTAVVEDHVLAAVGPDAVSHLKTLAFSADPDSPDEIGGIPVIRAAGYEAGPEGVHAVINGYRVTLPGPGIHNAANAAAVYAALLNLGYPDEACAEAVSSFSGVWRRFESHGKTSCGAAVYDDYAHNVEKICSCIRSVKEICRGKSMFIFQPHGYGPFKFMRQDLFPALEEVLGENDRFIFLPVYYAGGTSSFTPKAEDVAAEYASRHPGRYLYCEDRTHAAETAKQFLGGGDALAVMGARDNSLSDFAENLARTL